MPTSSILTTRLITLQSFKEVTWNTGAAATAKWMGVKVRPEFKPMVKADVFEEQRGTLVPGYLSAILMKGGSFKIPLHFTYEDGLYLMYGGVQGGVTPSGSGTYTYDFVGGGSAAWNAQSFTFEFGYDLGTIKANGCLVKKWSIRGEAAKWWEAELEGWYGTHDGNATLTGALTDRAVEVVLMPTTKVYIDPTGATIGTTEIVNSLLSFSMEYETGLTPVYTGGSLVPIGFTYSQIQTSLKVSLLYTAAVKALLNTYVAANSQMLIRLKSTSGTKVAQMDFAGVLTEDPTLYPDKESAQYIELSLSGIYNTGLAGYFKAQMVNGVSALV